MHEAIVIGTSAGGIYALEYLLPYIAKKSRMPVFVVQHISAGSNSYFVKMLKGFCQRPLKEPCSTEKVKGGTIYIAPPNYHLLIESDLSLTLNSDEKVNFSRPSIDILFETAADAYQEKLVGILLTGANSDGSKGLLKIKNQGGVTIVQDPQTAYMSEMPQSALRLFKPDHIFTLKQIAHYLMALTSEHDH